MNIIDLQKKLVNSFKMFFEHILLKISDSDNKIHDQ